MILVDSSVWFDHLRRADSDLSRLLAAGLVLCHPFVIGELACGHLRRCDVFLAELGALPVAPTASHVEAMALVEHHGLAGGGIGWTDVHLLASTLLARPAGLWTRDKRRAAVAESLGCLYAARTH